MTLKAKTVPAHKQRRAHAQSHGDHKQAERWQQAQKRVAERHRAEREAQEMKPERLA